MINNISNSSPTTSAIYSTPDGLRQRRKTLQLVQITNTSKEIETEACCQDYKKASASVIAGFSAFGAGFGIALSAISGVGIAGVIATGVVYSIGSGAVIKTADKYLLNTDQKPKEKLD